MRDDYQGFSPMRDLWRLLVLLFELIVPRFVVEDVVCEPSPEGWVPTYALSAARPGEYIPALLRMRSLSWLGSGWYPKAVSPVRVIGKCYQGVPF